MFVDRAHGKCWRVQVVALVNVARCATHAIRAHKRAPLQLANTSRRGSVGGHNAVETRFLGAPLLAHVVNMFSANFGRRAHCSLENERTDELHACRIGQNPAKSQRHTLPKASTMRVKVSKPRTRFPSYKTGRVMPRGAPKSGRRSSSRDIVGRCPCTHSGT
jgi:hypothetical protein